MSRAWVALVIFSLFFSAVSVLPRNFVDNNTARGVSVGLEGSKGNPIYVSSTATVSGTLTDEQTSAWLEFAVEPGFYNIFYELRNGMTDLSPWIYVDLYEQAYVYSPALGRNVTVWSYLKSLLWGLFDCGSLAVGTENIYVRKAGNIALKIWINEPSFPPANLLIEYSFTLEKVESFEGLDSISGENAIELNPNDQAVVYKLEPGIYNLSVTQKNYKTETEYEFLYPLVDFYDVDPGEKIEVYVNDTKVSTITYSGYEATKIENPSTGTYNVKLKFSNTSKSDGIYIYEVYMIYLPKGVNEASYKYYWVYQWLSATNDEITLSFTFNKIKVVSRVYYEIYDPELGETVDSYKHYINKNGSFHDLIYTEKETYLIIRKVNASADVDINVTLNEITSYTTISVGEEKTITLSPSEKEIVLLDLGIDEISTIDLAIENNVEWDVYLEIYGYEDWASIWEDTHINESSKLVDVYSIYLEDGLYNGTISGYSSGKRRVYMTRMEYEDSELVDVDYLDLETPRSKFFAILYGYNYSNEDAVVRISIEDSGGIEYLTNATTKSIEIRYGGAIYAIYKFNATIGNKYLIKIEPTSVEYPGEIYASIATVSDYNTIRSRAITSDELNFDKENDTPIMLEYVTNYDTSAYLIIKRVGCGTREFNGTISISFEYYEPEKTSEFSWNPSYGDYIEVFAYDFGKGKTYRLTVNKTLGVSAYILFVSKDGTLPYYEYSDSSSLAFGWVTYYVSSTTTNETFVIQSNYNGRAYIIIRAYGQGWIRIKIEDITPKTLNMIIWLPIGIAIGAIVVIIITKAIKKRAE